MHTWANCAPPWLPGEGDGGPLFLELVEGGSAHLLIHSFMVPFSSPPPPQQILQGPLGGAAAATCTGPCWVPDVPPKRPGVCRGEGEFWAERQWEEVSSRGPRSVDEG